MSEKKSIKTFWDSILEAGWTKLGFIGAALLAWFTGFTPLGIPVGWGLVFIAVYVNLNTIWKHLLRLINEPIIDTE